MHHKQARKLQATLEVCNPKLSLTDLLTGVKCRATSVAKKSVSKGLKSAIGSFQVETSCAYSVCDLT